jgi:type II secretory pathway pseudopilin PulG
MNNRKIKSGFTLLELVIAMGIFMIFITAILNTFITLTATQQKANLSREAMSEAKEILSFISIEAREKRIDYSCSNKNTSGTPATSALSIECLTKDAELVFITNDGLNRILIKSKEIKIETENEDQTYKEVIAQTQTRPNIFSAWQQPIETPLHSPRLKIKDFTVEINPAADPYDLSQSTEYLQHPVAQIRLVVERNSENKNPDQDSEPIVIQTSIASRAYSPQEI